MKDRRPGKKTIRIVIYTMAGMAVVFSALLSALSFGGVDGDQPVVPPDKEHYVIFPPEIPETLYFAGERVPLEMFDVRESLDRELLSNMYFHSQTLRLIKLSYRYFPEVEPILGEEGVPVDFKYLMVAESNLTNAVSPAGAVGFWQLVKGTAADYGLEVDNEVDERYDLVKSTRAACNYLKESYGKYENWTLAAASYNAGRRGIDNQVERQKVDNYYDLLLNEETARYVFRILALKLIMEDPAAFGIHISMKDIYEPVPYYIDTITGPVVDFADYAFAHQTNYKMLKFLNPWLRDNKLSNPRGRTYEIRIPEPGYRENAGELDK